MYPGNQMNKYDAACEVAREVEPRTLTQSLQDQKTFLEGKLARVNAALKAIEDHPDLVAFTETIAKAGY